MPATPCTPADEALRCCLTDKTEQLRRNISEGRPYVWELRLGRDEFSELETAIKASIASHNGEHRHLINEDFALKVVIYAAEWYKRFYKGNDTTDEHKVLSLTTDDLKRIYQLAHIDENVFVYNASSNPDRKSMRWLESMQVLGGLAVEAELNRAGDDTLPAQLCRLFHGEDIDLDRLKDHDRAVAFRESIACRHSLYEYLDCILDKTKEMPFAPSDLKDERTRIPELVRHIREADKIAKKDKFDFEWVITYTAGRSQMLRHLRVRLKPEVLGGGRRQYIGYDRLRQWGEDRPESVGRILFYLRFKNGRHEVTTTRETHEPLFKYDNTGSETTGFLSINKMDEAVRTDIPVERFNKVELLMKYNGTVKVVQTLEVKDYLQVYVLPQTGNRFSSRCRSQAVTAVVFPEDYKLSEDYRDLSIAQARYRNGEALSEVYSWCVINDKVVLTGPDGKEISPPLFNRSGLYQVVVKRYADTIKYVDDLFVRYRYVEDDSDEEEEDSILPLFGRSGLEVRRYADRQDKEGECVTDYSLEWLKGAGYVDWKEGEQEPEQGVRRLRVTAGGHVFRLRVYYVPFEPRDDRPPIWRDFEHKCIRTALTGVEEKKEEEDYLERWLDEPQPDTRELVIGEKAAHICVDVYRPIILRELSQRGADGKSHVVELGGKNEDIAIPLICCDRFSLREFSERGVKTYHINKDDAWFYCFPTFNVPNLASQATNQEQAISELNAGIPLDYLKVYITKALDTQVALYAWDYKREPWPVAGAGDLQDEGIVFQSLKGEDASHPRHYVMAITNVGRGVWGRGPIAELEANVLRAFEIAAEHRIYFFLFKPLRRAVYRRSQVRDIIIPLIRKRDCRLTPEDKEYLYRFAVHFHFDWMLLPRELWQTEIGNAASTDEERERLWAAVMDFFASTPKATDERERLCLAEFLEKSYRTFGSYPQVDRVAEAALRLILNDPDATGREGMRDFLKKYDSCRYKFSDMSRAIPIDNSTDEI